MSADLRISFRLAHCRKRSILWTMGRRATCYPLSSLGEFATRFKRREMTEQKYGAYYP